MASYTIISDIGNSIIKILKDNIVPSVISNPDNIGLCNPGDRGDISLSVFLYDIRENDEIRVSGMLPSDTDKQNYPPIYLSLYYMITAFVGSDIRFRSSEEQRILGKVIQTLRDNPCLSAETLESTSIIKPMDIHISLLQLSQEDKLKLWNVPTQPYKLSLFYKVAPIELESVKTKEVKRVTETSFHIHES